MRIYLGSVQCYNFHGEVSLRQKPELGLGIEFLLIVDL